MKSSQGVVGLGLVLVGSEQPQTFTAFVPDGAGGWVARRRFERQGVSIDLALKLGALIFSGAVGTLLQQNRTRRAAAHSG